MAEIHRWNLQETAGTTVADSVGSNHGSIDAFLITSGIINLGVQGPGSGLPYGVDLSGSPNDPITLASTVALAAGSHWSIAFWAKQDLDDTHGMVLGDNTQGASFVFLSSTASTNGFRVRSSAGTDSNFTVSAATRTKWTHYALTHDVSGGTPTLSLFVDGVFSESFAVAGGVGLNIKTLGSGFTGTDQVMDGRLADIRLFDAVMSQTEIDALLALGGKHFLDNFSGSSGTLLTAHTPDVDNSGNGWAVLQGTEPMLDGSGLLDFVATDTVISFDSQADGEISAVMVPSDDLSTSGPVFRMQDASNFLVVLCRGFDGVVTLRRRIGGTFFTSATYTPAGYTQGSPITIKVTYQGTSIAIEINGVADAITKTLTDFQTETLAGYRSSSTADLDSIQFTPPIGYSLVDKTILVIGQSNAEGRFDNNQVYSHASLYASVFEGTAWAELIDTGTNGEVWPLVAQRWLDDRSETVGFIYAAVGGTGLVDTTEWAAGGSAYAAMQSLVTASSVSKVDAILWFQGERDAANSVSRTAYAAAMDDLLTRLHADLPGSPAPLVVGQISYNTGDPDSIRNAQADSWANPNIYAGPVTYDIGPLADNLHFTTDAEAVTLADRWWAAIDEALFDGTVGTPPKLVSAAVLGSTLSLTYGRDLEAATTYTPGVWTFDDGGSAIAVAAASKTGTRTVSLTLASVPASASRTITLGTGNTAQGDDLPRGLGGQPALPETFAVATGDGAEKPWEILGVKNVQRLISVS